MPPKKKKGKKAPKKAEPEPSEAPSASAADLLAVDVQSVGGSSAASRSMAGTATEKKKKKGTKGNKKKEEGPTKKQEEARRAEEERLAKIEQERLAAEKKEKERQALIAAKQVPILELYAQLNQEMLQLVKPMVEAVQAKHLQSIKDGNVQIEEEVTPKAQNEYAKAVREHKLGKLRQFLNSQRNVLLKRDFEARSKDIANLESSAAEDNWLESYKKLKVKMKGEKDPPKLPVQYYNGIESPQ